MIDRAVPPSLAAVRMRRYRERRQLKLCCITIQLRASELDALIKWELLAPEQRTDRSAITRALHKFLDSTLGRTW